MSRRVRPAAIHRWWHNSSEMWTGQVFCIKPSRMALMKLANIPGKPSLPLALSPPSLTVAWKNNWTWKTIKTILPKFLKMDSQLLASFHRLRCGENMTCRKILKSLLFIGAKEWVFNYKVPSGGGLQDTPAFVSSRSTSLNPISAAAA